MSCQLKVPESTREENEADLVIEIPQSAMAVIESDRNEF